MAMNLGLVRFGVARSFRTEPFHLIFYLLEMPFYAVAVGKTPGIYKTWEECQNQTKGYQKAKFKKFNTESEAANFIKTYGSKNIQNIVPQPHAATIPMAIENAKPPILKAVSKSSSHALLKQDKLTLIADKLDQFMEEVTNRLNEFSARLDALESTVYSKDTKRKCDTLEDAKENLTKKQKYRTATTDDDDDDTIASTSSIQTRSATQSTSGTEEIDGPSAGYYSPSPHDFITDLEGFVVVYTDGACSNNGRSGAKAGIGVWFNHHHQFNIAAPVEGSATNNNAEIQAATRAIEQANLAGIKRLNIHTDSQFMINCMTDWIKKWKRNNWTTANGGPVKNKEQLIMLDEALKKMGGLVKWTHVRGHLGNVGNECADSLARRGATMY